MKIRHYQAGDEAAQVAIYNAAAGHLPKFKPATIQEVQRRVRAKDFDPSQRFYAEVDGQVVGYCNFTTHGRLSYPWVLPGRESAAQPLFESALTGMKRGGISRPFVAYRGDWSVILDFFKSRGFRQVRDMVNYLVEFQDLPTPSGKTNTAITAARPDEVERYFALNPAVLRVDTAREFGQVLFHNPYLPPESLFVLRSRQTQDPLALGLLINESTYADPKSVDANMPCFRLGAFGAETMTAKRLRGLFSFLARPDPTLPTLAMDLLNHAVQRIGENEGVDCLAAQTASDAVELCAFYDRTFRRQGSFPVLERAIA